MEEQNPSTQPSPSHTPGTGKGEEKRKTQGKETGRQDVDSTGEANRPAGTTTAQTSTGINPDKENPVDPASPHLPTP